MACQYYLVRQGTEGKYVLPSDKAKLKIGRSTDNDIVFRSTYVSRHHCEIVRIASCNTFIITNESNTNNTMVDSITLNHQNPTAELAVGAIIGLGVPTEYIATSSSDPNFVYLKLQIEMIPKMENDEILPSVFNSASQSGDKENRAAPISNKQRKDTYSSSVRNTKILSVNGEQASSESNIGHSTAESGEVTGVGCSFWKNNSEAIPISSSDCEIELVDLLNSPESVNSLPSSQVGMEVVDKDDVKIERPVLKKQWYPVARPVTSESECCYSNKLLKSSLDEEVQYKSIPDADKLLKICPPNLRDVNPSIQDLNASINSSAISSSIRANVKNEIVSSDLLNANDVTLVTDHAKSPACENYMVRFPSSSLYCDTTSAGSSRLASLLPEVLNGLGIEYLKRKENVSKDEESQPSKKLCRSIFTQQSCSTVPNASLDISVSLPMSKSAVCDSSPLTTKCIIDTGPSYGRELENESCSKAANILASSQEHDLSHQQLSDMELSTLETASKDTEQNDISNKSISISRTLLGIKSCRVILEPLRDKDTSVHSVIQCVNSKLTVPTHQTWSPNLEEPDSLSNRSHNSEDVLIIPTNINRKRTIVSDSESDDEENCSNLLLSTSTDDALCERSSIKSVLAACQLQEECAKEKMEFRPVTGKETSMGASSVEVHNSFSENFRREAVAEAVNEKDSEENVQSSSSCCTAPPTTFQTRSHNDKNIISGSETTNISELRQIANNAAEQEIKLEKIGSSPDSLPELSDVKPVLPGVKIKEELISTSDNGIKIKKEITSIRDDSGNNYQLYENVDDDDDDVLVAYSQVDDEVIYISSDDEDSADREGNSDSCSFGPLPASADRSLDELGDEDQDYVLSQISEEIISAAEDEADGSRSVTADATLRNDEVLRPLEDMHDDEDDLYIFSPVKRNKSPVMHEVSENCSDLPSRGSDLNDKDKCIPNYFKSHKNIKEKLCHRKVNNDAASKNQNYSDYIPEVQKTILIEPLQPPLRRSLTKDRKQKDQSRHSDDSLASTSATSIRKKPSHDLTLTDRENRSSSSDVQNSGSNCKTATAEQKITNARRTRKGKNESIRKKIMKTHNLDAYKTIAATIGREKHHLVSETTKQITGHSSALEHKSLPLPEANRHSRTIVHNSGKKSVKPRTDDPHTSKKGVTKVSKASGNQKLAEIPLFKLPNRPKANVRSSYKIPKISKGDTLELDRNAASSRKKAPVSEKPVLQDLSVKAPSILGDAKDNLTSGSEDTHSASAFRGILKTPCSKPVQRKSVKFPQRNDALCKTVLIPPRDRKVSKDFSGPNSVKERELYFKDSRAGIIPHNQNPQEFIHCVCSWNYDWLSTYSEAKRKRGSCKPPQPPSVGKSTMLPTLTTYESYHDYKEVFSNLMYYEVWENIYRDWEQHNSTNVWFASQIDTIQNDVFWSGAKLFKYLSLKIIVPITSDWSLQGKHPTQGSLIVIKYAFIDKQNRCTLGYVQNVFKKYESKFIPQDLKTLCTRGENTVLELTVSFSKSYLEREVKPGMIISVRNVSYIRPSFRAFEALCSLEKSPLHSVILNPGDLNMYKHYGQYQHYSVNQLNLNVVQKDVVIKVSDKCVSFVQEPKISLIHGPPGTGKTSTIAALIVQMNHLYKESSLSDRRILLCAPSNAAVDEVTRRLLKLQQKNIHLNIVRVGLRHSISEDIKDCSFEVRVRKEFERRTTQPTNKLIANELQRKRYYITKATEDYEKALAFNESVAELRRLNDRLMTLLRSERELKQRSAPQLSTKERTSIYNDCKKMVLMTAEVITCTLSSCLSGPICEIFGVCKQQTNFACCIVDEAGQCKETETWQPLKLGIKKLILVGDHLQLPATVLSHVAQGKKLHQSLFERIYHHIGIEQDRMDCIHSLTVQYRMHPDICLWPSSYFYHNELKTAPEIIQDRNSFLKPYLIFDIENSNESSCNKGEIYNMVEIQAVGSLIQCIEPQLKTFSVGILTPYQKQKIMLLEKLKPFMNNMNLTVDTVDSSQGQERDVIICSFVRANASSRLGFVTDRHRLNVAVTRAKKALFIFGHLSSLKASKDWKFLIDNALQRNVVVKINSASMLQNSEWLYRVITV